MSAPDSGDGAWLLALRASRCDDIGGGDESLHREQLTAETQSDTVREPR